MKPLYTTVLALFTAASAASIGVLAAERQPAPGVTIPAAAHRSNAMSAPFAATSTMGGPNGIIHSAPLNHAIVVQPTGTSLNIVSGALDDTGPDDANWDFNFFSDHGVLEFWKVNAGNSGHYALDPFGMGASLRPGDVIGPATEFSSGYGSVLAAYGWLTGTDGYLGVRLNCDGRLPFPVAGGVCYGYLRIRTTAPFGFPATILYSVFDGDGNAIDIPHPPPPEPPQANVSPAGGLDFTVRAGTIGTDTLVIGNTGGSDLIWSLAESFAGRTNPPSYRNTPAARYATGVSDPPATLASARGQGVRGFGQPFVLDTTTISQMEDNTPGDEGVSCGTTGVSTADNSWWRRFYFNEHPQVGASAHIISVTVSTGSIAVAGGLPTTVNLYTIPHSTAVDTIPTSALTLIGTATATVNGTLSTTTIPVTGTVSDTAAQDLVVEWHTDGSSVGQYFPGANASAETHPTFLSSSTCGISQPTPAASLGFPDFHLVLMATFGKPEGGDCLLPLDIPWLSADPSSGTVAPAASEKVSVTVDAATLAEGTYAANLCVSVNDTVLTLISVPVRLTVTAAETSDGFFCSGFEVDEDGSCAGPVATPVPGDIVVSGLRGDHLP